MDCLSAENEQGGNGLSRETVDFLCSPIPGFTRDCDEVAAKAAGKYLALQYCHWKILNPALLVVGRVKAGDYFWPLQIAHIYLLYLFTCIYFWF